MMRRKVAKAILRGAVRLAGRIDSHPRVTYQYTVTTRTPHGWSGTSGSDVTRV